MHPLYQENLAKEDFELAGDTQFFGGSLGRG